MSIKSLLAAVFAGSSIVLAQMSGGMPGNGMGPGHNLPDTPSGQYMQMFQGMGGMPAMGSGMGVGMTDDLTIGTDGTIYVIRSIASAQSGGASASWQFELAALSPANGSISWKLAIPGSRVSRPVVASDGLIYLTVDNYPMFYANFASGGSMMTPEQAQANDGQLLVVTQSKGSASILRTIQIASDVLSAPRVVADSVGSYAVYVLGYDMMSWTPGAGSGSSSFGPGEKTLYSYRPDGTLKFSIALSQTPAGSMQP